MKYKMDDPLNFKKLPKYHGYYIPQTIVFAEGEETGWKDLLSQLSENMQKHGFRFDNSWAGIPGTNQSRYIALTNGYVDISIDVQVNVVAVFLLIPERNKSNRAARRYFATYRELLCDALKVIYPGSVYEKVSTWESQKVG